MSCAVTKRAHTHTCTCINFSAEEFHTDSLVVSVWTHKSFCTEKNTFSSGAGLKVKDLDPSSTTAMCCAGTGTEGRKWRQLSVTSAFHLVLLKAPSPARHTHTPPKGLKRSTLLIGSGFDWEFSLREVKWGDKDGCRAATHTAKEPLSGLILCQIWIWCNEWMKVVLIIHISAPQSCSVTSLFLIEVQAHAEGKKIPQESCVCYF